MQLLIVFLRNVEVDSKKNKALSAGSLMALTLNTPIIWLYKRLLAFTPCVQ